MKNSLLFVPIVLLFLFSLQSCENERKVPDTSNIDLQLNINRFEQDLFSIDSNHVEEGILQLNQKYPAFSELFFTRILPLKRGINSDSAFFKNVKGLITFKPIQRLVDTCNIVFSDMNDIESQLTSAYKYYKYYFPKKDVPNIYTLISEYAYQTFLFDDNAQDGIGISLDMFLGSNYPYAQIDPQNTAFSNYLTRTFNKEHLVKKTLDATIDDLVGVPKGNRLLDLMIHNGKKLYILDHLLPHTHDSIKLEYTKSQLDWVNSNEKQTWAHFLAEDLLYETNAKKIAKLINPSPKAPPGMPTTAPGRVANWMGWRIVNMYMRRNPNVSMDQLIIETDAQSILSKSKYKPKR